MTTTNHTANDIAQNEPKTKRRRSGGIAAALAACLVLTPLASVVHAAPAQPQAPAFSSAPFAQTELIRPPNGHDMSFGNSMAVSGNTLVVGAPYENGSVTSTLASPNELCTWCGAAYVYERQNDEWVLTDYLKAYNANTFDRFGAGVAIEGDTILIGAPWEDSAAGASYTETLTDESGTNTGAVYVYTRTAGSWNFDQLIKPTGAEDAPTFGQNIEIDDDTFVVGATEENYLRGAVYVFTRSGGVWSQQARLTKPNRAISERFGTVALDGDTLAVGAADENSYTGAIYMFTRSGISWTLQMSMTGFNTARGDGFGSTIDLHNGTLVVGVSSENGSITSTVANPNAFGYADGAVYVYTGSGANWTLQSYLKAFNTGMEPDEGVGFGSDVSVYSDTLLISSSDSGSITATQNAPNAVTDKAGAAYVYTRSGSTWNLQQYIKSSRPDEYDYFGLRTLLRGNWIFLSSRSDADTNAWCNVKGAGSGSVYFYQLGRADASLSALSLAGAVSVSNEIQSQPWFQSYYGCYDALLPANPNTVTVGYTTAAVGASVQVAVSSTTNPSFQACAAAVCPVDIGDNVIKVTVTATDTTTTREYVVRALRPAPSSDATLSALAISPGALHPAFVSSTTAYTETVAHAVDTVTVTAVANDVGAALSYAASPGAGQQPAARAAVPAPGIPCSLNVGVNVITMTVTASDDTTQDYVITVTRADAPPSGLEIGNVWPKTGVPEGGMPVAIFGAGFTGALTVTVDGVSVPFTKTHDGRIDLIMPPGTDGDVVDFTVYTADSSVTAAQAFTYVAPETIVLDGSAGGVFTTSAGVVVAVPSQGVSGSFIITLTPVPPQDGLPGDVLMHSFRLDALLNGVPVTVLSQPVTINLPVDVSIVPAGERPWLYVWTAGEERGERSEQREEEGSALTSHTSSLFSRSSPLTSRAGGRWTLVPGQSYDPVNQRVTVALRPMELYALSTTLIRDYWFPLVPPLK
jgi:hypothetical protein